MLLNSDVVCTTMYICTMETILSTVEDSLPLIMLTWSPTVERIVKQQHQLVKDRALQNRVLNIFFAKWHTIGRFMWNIWLIAESLIPILLSRDCICSTIDTYIYIHFQKPETQVSAVQSITSNRSASPLCWPNESHGKNLLSLYL